MCFVLYDELVTQALYYRHYQTFICLIKHFSSTFAIGEMHDMMLSPSNAIFELPESVREIVKKIIRDYNLRKETSFTCCSDFEIQTGLWIECVWKVLVFYFYIMFESLAVWVRSSELFVKCLDIAKSPFL